MGMPFAIQYWQTTCQFLHKNKLRNSKGLANKLQRRGVVKNFKMKDRVI